MRVKSAVLGVLFAMAPVFPALAQHTASLAQIIVQEPKPGMSSQYQAGRKKHMGWHKAQKDTWSWLTWEVVSGEHTGTYVTGTFGHEWKDFDGREKFEAADVADLTASVGPSTANTRVSYYVRRDDISFSPAPTGTPPAFLAVTGYLLRPDGVNDFIDAVKKVNEAIKKTNYPQAGPSRWYQLVNGGEGPYFVLVSDRPNWAAFKANDKTLDTMMEEAYGKEQGAAVLATIRKTFHTIRSAAYQFRPEMSYLPAK